MAEEPKPEIQEAEEQQNQKKSIINRITTNLSTKQIIGFLCVFITIYWAVYMKTPNPISKKTGFWLAVLTLIIAYLLLNKNDDQDDFDLPAAKKIARKEALEMQERKELPIGQIILMAEGTDQHYKTEQGYNPTQFYVALKLLTRNYKEELLVFRINIKTRRIMGIDRKPYGWNTADVRDYRIIPGPSLKEIEFQKRYLKP